MAYLDFPMKVDRFQAVVGLVTPIARPDLQVRFELWATRDGNDTRLWGSQTISHGQQESVDVSLDGVVRIGLKAIPVAGPNGPTGTAGWGDARVTAANAIAC